MNGDDTAQCIQPSSRSATIIGIKTCGTLTSINLIVHIAKSKFKGLKEWSKLSNFPSQRGGGRAFIRRPKWEIPTGGNSWENQKAGNWRKSLPLPVATTELTFRQRGKKEWLDVTNIKCDTKTFQNLTIWNIAKSKKLQGYKYITYSLRVRARK